MLTNILTVELRYEQDVVTARQRTRQIAALLGMENQDQTRMATAVSEIARNAFRYATDGKVTFAIESLDEAIFWIKINDHGKGISNLAQVLDGQYRSKTGMGMGIIGARRLMDHFDIKTVPGVGTSVTIGKGFKRGSQTFGADDVGELAKRLAAHHPEDPFAEVRQQNIEIMDALATLQKREAELSVERERLARLNRELEDTNRGVIALNMELEEQASALARASEVKSNFLAHMTHEFRTPVNSILSLLRVLATPMAGDVLSPERLKQISFIRSAAESLSELVNDLLDTAKAEAGRLDVHPKAVDVAELFGALRAMFKPMLVPGKPVELIFEEPDQAVMIYTDEGKLAQILRNFISNALKFTDEGYVKIQSAVTSHGEVIFSVTDSGIGIGASDQPRVFEDFTQIAGPHQQAKGTGLGLPLARRLAKLLGGEISLNSAVGEGSTFRLRLPPSAASQGAGKVPGLTAVQPYDKDALCGTTSVLPRHRNKILIIDDEASSRYVLRDLLKDTGFALVEASGGAEGLKKAEETPPAAIFLDLRMPGMDGFQVLRALKRNPRTRFIPVIINTSKDVEVGEFADDNVAPALILSKEDFHSEDAVKEIRAALGRAGVIFECMEEKICEV